MENIIKCLLHRIKTLKIQFNNIENLSDRINAIKKWFETNEGSFLLTQSQHVHRYINVRTKCEKDTVLGVKTKKTVINKTLRHLFQ